MYTDIAALGANALFPLVGFGLYRHSAAALVFLRMLCLGAYPLGGVGVVIGILVAVALAAVFAYRALKTGSGPAGVYAGVSALGAGAVFPFVRFGLYRNRSAALIFLCVLGLGTYPLRGVGVVVGVSVAVALAAVFAYCALKTGCGSALVYAGVSALGADAVFPLVRFGPNGHRSAALVFLRMLCFGAYPLRGVGVVIRSLVAVALAAGIASCALSACRRAASVTVLDQNGLHTAESEAVRSLGIDYNSDGVEIRKIIRR